MPERTAQRLPGGTRGLLVSIMVDGRPITAHAGEMLAGALMAAGIVQLRHSPSAGTPRGAFCLMGVCQECLVRIDGRVRQACMTTVREGLDVQLMNAGDDAT